MTIVSRQLAFCNRVNGLRVMNFLRVELLIVVIIYGIALHFFGAQLLGLYTTLDSVITMGTSITLYLQPLYSLFNGFRVYNSGTLVTLEKARYTLYGVISFFILVYPLQLYFCFTLDYGL